MKIQQLSMGTRFMYEGEEYVKTGPMVATGKGGQRLIPKYAILTPLGNVASAPKVAPNDPLARDAVLTAFDAFYAQCQTLIPAEKHSALDTARNDFLGALG